MFPGEVSASFRKSENISPLFASLLPPGTPYDPYKALWFERKKDPDTKEVAHVYRGGYWESKEKQDWTMCPDIF